MIGQLTAPSWDIVPTPIAEKAMTETLSLRSDWETRKAEVMAFLQCPDRQADIQQWVVSYVLKHHDMLFQLSDEPEDLKQ